MHFGLGLNPWKAESGVCEFRGGLRVLVVVGGNTLGADVGGGGQRTPALKPREEDLRIRTSETEKFSRATLILSCHHTDLLAPE